MAFQTAITIKEVLTNIRERRYALPSIQRELVWHPSQIERLFDSLMRGYPIGAFLFWCVKPESVKKYKFYDFVLNYHERDARHNQPLNVTYSESNLIAVLDGQQRLTALNIGLCGSYASKLPRLWWNNPDAFPKRHLYLNLLDVPDEDDDEMLYKFKFLNDHDAKERNDTTYWYNVADILKVEDSSDLIDAVHDMGLGTTREPLKILTRLHRVVHDVGIISFYEEKEQNLDKVLNIFVRTNSGGTVLSYSDILMSIATAQWREYDAREEIYGLVDDINQVGNGFSFPKDFVLKAGLMLSDINDIKFKVTNFNVDNMNKIQNEWEGIKKSVRNTVELAADFGYSSANLSANNALLPIAYYIHRNSLGNDLSKNRTDCNAIRLWLMKSLIKRGIWGSGLDTLLLAIRSAIRNSSFNGFPSDDIMATMRRLGKSLVFEDEELKDLVDAQYGDRRVYGILALLYPFIDVKTNQFHVDHIFPRAQMTASKLRRAGISEKDAQNCLDGVNRVANLQLLTGVVNQEKNAKLPLEWLNLHYTDPHSRNEHLDRHDLGDVPDGLAGFNDFYETRRERMLTRLRGILDIRRHGVVESEGG